MDMSNRTELDNNCQTSLPCDRLRMVEGSLDGFRNHICFAIATQTRYNYSPMHVSNNAKMTQPHFGKDFPEDLPYLCYQELAIYIKRKMERGKI